MNRFRLSTILLSLIVSIFNYNLAETLFSLDNGLPNCTVNAFAKDSEGRLWIATENGLCAYDGAKFATYNNYKSSLNNSLVLRDNMVTRLLSVGNKLYVGYTTGLQVVDTELFKIETIKFPKLSGDTIDVYVHSLIKDCNGDIIVGTLGNGLFRLKQGENVASQKGFDRLAEDFVVDIVADSDNRLYVGAMRKGLYILTPSAKGYSIDLVNKVKDPSISVMMTKEDNLYIGSPTGLYVYIRALDSYSRIPNSEKYDVTTLLMYRDSVLLVGTNESGMQCYDISENRFIDPINLNTISTTRVKVSAAYIGEDDRIWIGVAKRGIVYKPLGDNVFHYIGHLSSRNNVIGENAVTALSFTNDNKMLVATDNDRIYRLEYDKSKDKWCVLNEMNLQAGVSTIFEDSRNCIWLGMTNKGLCKINIERGELSTISDFENMSITGITEDKSGDLWISTMGYGLYKVDKTGHVLYKAPKTSGKLYTPAKNLLNNSWLTGTTLSHNNKLFINSCFGMGCLDLNTGSFINTFGENRILAGEMVRYSMEDKNNIIWIGTSSGLYRFNPGNKDLKSYTVADGLSSNTVLGIVQDNYGDLWLSTNNGITRMNIKDSTFQSYYKSDGLQGDEFMAKAIAVDKAGVIYMGGISGITYFNPKEVLSNGRELKVRITDFYVHNSPITPESTSGGERIIDRSLRSAQVFNLSADDNTFSVEFTTNDFINSEHIQYIYSINGDSWVEMPIGVNRIYFNKLPSGKYNIRVKAQYYNMDSEEKSINVIIAPHWYATIPAFVAYVLLAIIVAFIAVFLRKRRNAEIRILNEQAEKERINEALIKTLINIAHEIKTPISLILSPLDRLSAMGDDDRHKKLYSTMRHSSNRILTLINQLLSLRKIQKGKFRLMFSETDILDYINGILPMFDVQFQEKNIDFEIKEHVKSEYLKGYIDINYFDKILVNLLSNAVKFTPKGGKILLDVTEGDGKYVITVQDTGVGVSEQDMPHLFERFYQSTSKTSEVNVGIGIGLHYTQELVLLHHGTIEVKSNEHSPGTTFIITMPLGREHLSDNEIISADKQSVKSENIILQDINSLGSDLITNRRHYNVILIDDDEDILNYFKYELSTDFNVTIFKSGKEAIKAIPMVNPDLVISDIVMPDIDGISLCRKINNNINLNHIPIILLTADNNELVQREAMRSGADYYLTKPINVETLKCVAINLIEQREKLKNIYTGHQQSSVEPDVVKIPDYEMQFIKRVDDIIKDNIGNSEFTVEQLADAAGVGRVQLYRKIKSYSNQSPRDYVRNVRLKCATEMLANPRLNVSEIAYSLGFTSPQHFSNIFKETYGISPKQYREKMGQTETAYS